MLARGARRRRPAAMMERWSISIYKEAFHFSAAHFLIFPNGEAERLHGHNYRVTVEIESDLTEHGLVLDFKQVKPLVREICDELDEHFLVPGEHPVLSSRRIDGETTEVRYRDKRYLIPTEDVLVLPINNSSSENLATWFGRELRARLARRFAEVEPRRMSVSVEEAPGQCGVYRSGAEA
jgi:6-pyruvoyltetrahydropterin/6-carboxytetrahydropterin synthase